MRKPALVTTDFMEVSATVPGGSELNSMKVVHGTNMDSLSFFNFFFSKMGSAHSLTL